MKTILTSLLIILYLNCNAQQSIGSLTAGNKSFELSYNYLDEESELIYGVSFSVVDSKISEKRANSNDKGNIHEFKSDVVPAVFLNIGSKFEKLHIVGKLGGSFLEQSINGIKENKNIYLAFGIQGRYYVSDNTAFIASYDSVNSLMAGISINLNR